MPATTAAADEPRPRPCGIRFDAAQPEPGWLAPGDGERGAHGPYHQMDLARPGQVRALAGDLDGQAGLV